MLITSASLASLATGFKTIFMKALTNKKPTWEKVATLVPSESEEELYPWLGALPGFREWVGDRVVKSISAEGYRIVNKDFELTIAVPRSKIEDDKYGIYSPMFENMGIKAALYPDKRVWSLVKKGFTEKCYDGKPFFSADHKVGEMKVSNKGTSKLSVEAYAAARASMMSIVDEEKESIHITPSLLVVPPALETRGLAILNADFIDGSTNIYKGTAELHVEPWLAGADTSWFLFDTTQALKPFIFQERKKVQFVTQIKPDDEQVFMKAEYRYGCEARGNAGFGLWQQAYGSDGTTG